MSPAQVDACSLWQIEAAITGWAAAHSPDAEGRLTQDQEDDLWRLVSDEG